jgi:hypothetical protein
MNNESSTLTVGNYWAMAGKTAAGNCAIGLCKKPETGIPQWLGSSDIESLAPMGKLQHRACVQTRISSGVVHDVV